MVGDGETYPRGFARDIDWKWPLVPARNLVELSYGRALTADSRRHGKIPVYGTNGQCGWHDEPLTKGPGVVLGRKGQGPLGVEWCSSDFWVIDTAYFAKIIEPGLELKYFYHLVKYIGLNHLKDGTSNPTLSRDSFGSQLLPFPPVTVQKAIAAVLGALDDKIELNRRMNATLENMARALFQSWFVDFDPVRAKMDGRQPVGMDEATASLFPSSFQESPIGHIPTGWDAHPLPAIIEVNPRRSLKAGTLAPYLDMKNLPTQGHSAEEVVMREFSSGTKFQNGDTLLARITPCLENGKTGYVDFLEDEQVGWGSTEYIVFSPKPPLPAHFGYLLARSDALRTHAIQNMTGTSGRQRVPSECFSSFILPMPSAQILRIFECRTIPNMGKIKANVAESRTLAALRDTLLPKLLSGELRIKDAERFVSEVV